MKTLLLLLENDPNFPSAIEDFKEKFLEANPNTNLLEFKMLKTKSREEILEAITKATDIAFQTQFIGGSETQVEEIFWSLSKMKPKNIYIHNYDLKTHLEKYGDELLYRMRKHTINKITGNIRTDYETIEFTESINNYLAKIQQIRFDNKETLKIREESKNNPTGIKVKILACNANGREFEDIKIGSIVDTLDMSLLDPNPSRGVWIWGKTEPVKLVNDCGIKEYEIVNEKLNTEQLLELAFKDVGINPDSINGAEYRDLLEIFKDDEISSLEKSQFFCDTIGIERRGNRRKIADLIS